MNDELATLGITYRQWEVLCWLSFAGPVVQHELAERMLIEAPTLVGVLDRMERDGWIERAIDPQDRRRKVIAPTEKVEAVWNQMVQCARRVRAEATESIAPSDLEKVRETLATMRRNLAGDNRVDALAREEAGGGMLPAEGREPSS